jgi:hypothetical protein
MKEEIARKHSVPCNFSTENDVISYLGHVIVHFVVQRKHVGVLALATLEPVCNR